MFGFNLLFVVEITLKSFPDSPSLEFVGMCRLKVGEDERKGAKCEKREKWQVSRRGGCSDREPEN